MKEEHVNWLIGIKVSHSQVENLYNMTMSSFWNMYDKVCEIKLVKGIFICYNLVTYNKQRKWANYYSHMRSWFRQHFENIK